MHTAGPGVGITSHSLSYSNKPNTYVDMLLLWEFP